MHFHGAYFSNYDIWSRDPKHSLPSAQLIWQIIGQQAILFILAHTLQASDIGNSFQGIHITSVYSKYGELHAPYQSLK